MPFSNVTRVTILTGCGFAVRSNIVVIVNNSLYHYTEPGPQNKPH